jgi:site-specific DNA-methyltransferase (adenine-specific)
MNKVILGNCLEVMKTLPENSVDSICTDPPYHLQSIVKRFGKENSAPAKFGTDGAFQRASKGFMGKEWDGGDIAFNKEMWAEALRVLKPGGHLLSFGGTRTYHRMACAIEDAGFEVRDMVSWIYGSGFPKSLNIGKAVDKLQGNEREETDYVAPDGKKRWGGNSFSVGEEPDGRGMNKATKGTSPYEGWGTALKPACEPCVLARKPLSEKTVAENCLKWGTGGINIDGSRVEIPEGDDSGWSGSHAVPPSGSATDAFGVHKFKEVCRDKPTGRFPANLIHDGSDEVLEVFPNTKVGARKAGQLRHTKDGDLNFTGNTYTVNDYPASEGNASRFFYCAKTSKSERNKGCEELEEVVAGGMAGRADGSLEGNIVMNRNNHPTVKPQALMKYLITLITPKGGTVLDPFAGSGSTLVAAKNLGFNYIGIEMTPEYIPIIEARLK